LPHSGQRPSHFVDWLPHSWQAKIVRSLADVTLAGNYRAGLRQLPDRSVLITFDDGFSDNQALAWPIAQEFGIKFNLFICTGLINGERIAALQGATPAERASREEFPELWRPLLWSQLEELNAAGVGLGFHSHSHRNLETMTPAEIAADAAVGISLLKKHLGFRPRFLAFPFGHYGSYSVERSAILQEHGLEMFFTTELGRTALENSQRIFSRIVVHPEDDANSFRPSSSPYGFCSPACCSLEAS